jgi:hypothetical protein
MGSLVREQSGRWVQVEETAHSQMGESETGRKGESSRQRREGERAQEQEEQK